MEVIIADTLHRNAEPSNINMEARADARQLLSDFLTGKITDFECEDAFRDRFMEVRDGKYEYIEEARHDLAIHEAWDWIFITSALEMKPNRIGIDYTLDIFQRKRPERLLLFLRTNMPYEWPEPTKPREGVWPFRLLHRRPKAPSSPQGDESVWPFFRKEDFISAWRDSGMTGDPEDLITADGEEDPEGWELWMRRILYLILTAGFCSVVILVLLLLGTIAAYFAESILPAWVFRLPVKYLYVACGIGFLVSYGTLSLLYFSCITCYLVGSIYAMITGWLKRWGGKSMQSRP